MFDRIMLPVDLAHVETLGKSIEVATEMAKAHDASITVVGVTGTGPGPLARTPAGYVEKLDSFASDLARKSGADVASHAIADPDPAAALSDALLGAAKDMEADLIVMASHVPGVMEHVFSSHAGYVASHAKCSVAVVR